MNKFSIFFSSGGGEDIKIVDTYWQKISKLFDVLSQKEYTTKIKNFHIALRVDGEFISFGDPEGCSNLKYFKSKNTIANTISFGKKIYKNETVLRNFLKENLLKAFEEIVNKLLKEKVDIESKELIEDLKMLINETL